MSAHPGTARSAALGGPPRGCLVAKAARLDGNDDPLDVAGPGGAVWLSPTTTLVGRGEAARVVVPAGRRSDAAELVHRALEAIARDGTPGAPPPAALGALPFDPAAAASLVVPEVQVRRGQDGARWLLHIAPAGSDGPPPPLHAPVAPPPPPERFTLVPRTSHAAHRAAVARLVDEIRDGPLRKVVLARAVDVDGDRPFDTTALLARLRTGYPTCLLFAVDGFVGASPELLVARAGDVVRGQPMAGTVARTGDPVADARLAARLLASPKDRHEHDVTIEAMHDALLPWCSFLDAEPEPHVAAVANVQHLATTVEGRLSRPLPSVLELVGALHPTPAVGGDPTAAALSRIAALEPGGRGRYAGPVGWVDAEGDGEWAVGIRSAEVQGRRATLYAGGGIVSDSDPDAELAETQAKLAAVLGALVRP